MEMGNCRDQNTGTKPNSEKITSSVLNLARSDMKVLQKFREMNERPPI